jgi:organic radical activating enzyme
MKYNILTDLYTEGGHKPNFTIITPGFCNAKCGFCFWNSKDGKIVPPSDYIQSLIKAFNEIPYSICPALSISGGEPTISGHLGAILHTIKNSNRKWDRVVLTTNGSALESWLKDDLKLMEVVTHINISRHHFDDNENQKIFKSKVVPTTPNIKNIIRNYGNKYQFNINCIINDSTTEAFIQHMIAYAFVHLEVGSISFRKEAGDVSPTNVEKIFTKRWGIESSNDCPVCRTTIQVSKDKQILWKGSHPEPSQYLNKLYELVFHPNGKLYADWSRKIEVDTNMKPTSPDGAFWYEKWANLVKEFEAHKEIQETSHKKIIEKLSGIEEVNKKLLGSTKSTTCNYHSGGCGSRPSSCGGGCGGGCG